MSASWLSPSGSLPRLYPPIQPLSIRSQIWGLHLLPFCFISQFVQKPGRERQCFLLGSLRKFPPSIKHLAQCLVHCKCPVEVPASRSRNRWSLRVCLVTGLMHKDARKGWGIRVKTGDTLEVHPTPRPVEQHPPQGVGWQWDWPKPVMWWSLFSNQRGRRTWATS